MTVDGKREVVAEVTDSRNMKIQQSGGLLFAGQGPGNTFRTIGRISLLLHKYKIPHPFG